MRSFRDIAVFYRINAQSRALEDELVKNGIPYTIVGGMKFYERKEIKDILAYLKLIANPSDSLSLKRIINIPSRGIGEKTIEKIEQFSRERGLSLYEGLKQSVNEDWLPAGVKKKIETFVHFMEKLRKEAADFLPQPADPSPSCQDGISPAVKGRANGRGPFESGEHRGIDQCDDGI